jgi:hypothetical protein
MSIPAVTINSPSSISGGVQVIATDVVGAANNRSAIQVNPALSLLTGTNVGQVNAVATESFSLTSGATFTLNLQNYTDPLGNTGQAQVHWLGALVQNAANGVTGTGTAAAATGLDLVVGGGTTPAVGFTATNIVQAGGFFMSAGASGYSISTSTCNVQIAGASTAGTNSVGGTISFIGRST